MGQATKTGQSQRAAGIVFAARNYYAALAPSRPLSDDGRSAAPLRGGTVRIILAMVAAGLLSACAIVGAVDAVAAKDNYKKCVAAYNAGPDAQMLKPRIWQGDGTDSADKLTDPKPLTPAERDALIRGHAELVKCRQIIISHDSVFAAWELPHFQALFARTDALFTKMAAGEVPMGTANQLMIASLDEFQVEQSRGQADESRFQQVQATQRAAAAAQVSAAYAANQPRMTTTNCTWIGNSINCTGMR